MTAPTTSLAAPVSVTAAVDLESAVTVWEAGLREQSASSHTLGAYGRDLLAFLIFWADRLGHPVGLVDLASLQAEDFRSYFGGLSAQGRAAASIARAHCTLRNFFRFLGDQDLVCNLAINAVAAPKIPKPVQQALSTEAAEKAVKAIADLSDAPWIAKRDEALFALLYGSGLRLGEALALTRSEAPRGEPLTIAGRNGRRRTVPVLAFVPALIADYLRACPYSSGDDQPLFVGVRGGPLNPGVVQRQMRRLRGLLGLPDRSTPQALRQCFAQRLRAEGGDLRAIQTLLGHAHLATTQRCFDTRAGQAGKITFG